jgi:hypothetical protein
MCFGSTDTFDRDRMNMCTERGSILGPRPAPATLGTSTHGIFSRLPGQSIAAGFFFFFFFFAACSPCTDESSRLAAPRQRAVMIMDTACAGGSSNIKNVLHKKQTSGHSCHSPSYFRQGHVLAIDSSSRISRDRAKGRSAKEPGAGTAQRGDAGA